MTLEYKKAALAELRQLNVVFSNAFEDRENYQGNLPSDSYLAGLLSREDFIPLVAAVEGEVVGGLVAFVLQKFEQERKEIYIYDLAVLASYRRTGIATTLINKLREIAREIGAYLIYVQADPPDLPAVRLYGSLGTREDVIHFGIEP